MILLAIDIGNTSTAFGLFKESKALAPAPFRTFRIPTPFLLSAARLSRHGSLPKMRPDEIILSSVVPKVNKPLSAFLKRHFGVPIQFVSPQFSGRIQIRYRVPSELGADRIVNGRAAMALTKGAAVVVDFGTATTFDCLSSKQEFLGGVIAPGPVISAEALFRKTAQLPLVSLSKPAPIIGKNTVESIHSGLYHGYRGLVKEILERLKEKLGPKTLFLATGGQAPLILKGLPFRIQYHPYLTLTGLFLLWRDNRTISH